MEKQQESEDLKEWLVKLIGHLEKEIERIIKRKRKKLKNLCTGETFKQLVDERFLEMKVLIYRPLINLTKVLMSFFWKERSSLTVQQYVVIYMMETLLPLTLLIYLAILSLRIKFLFFQKESNFSLLVNM